MLQDPDTPRDIPVDEELVVVAKVPLGWHQDIVRAQLAEHGIESWIDPIEGAHLPDGELPGKQWGPVSIAVFRRDVEDALHILRQQDAVSDEELDAYAMSRSIQDTESDDIPETSSGSMSAEECAASARGTALWSILIPPLTLLTVFYLYRARQLEDREELQDYWRFNSNMRLAMIVSVIVLGGWAMLACIAVLQS